MESKNIRDLGNSEEWSAIFPKIRQVMQDGNNLGVNVEALILSFGLLNKYGKPLYINMTNCRKLADMPPTEWRMGNMLATYIVHAFEQGRELERMLAKLEAQERAEAAKGPKPYPGQQE